MPTSAFWWQWPWEQDAAAAHRRARSQPQPAVVDRLGEQLLDQARGAGHRRGRRVLWCSATCSSRQGQQAARLDPDDRHALLGERGQPGRHPRGQLAGLVQQAFEMLARPQQPLCSTRDPPAGQLQQLDRCDRIAGSVQVVNESARNTTSPSGNGPAGARRLASQRSRVSRRKRGRGRAAATPEHPLGERPRQPRAPRQVDSGASAEPSAFSRSDGREQPARVGTPCRSWLTASVSALRAAMSTPSGHSRLQALQLQAQVEIPCRQVASERCHRVRRRKRHDQRVGASSSWQCSSSRGGHVRRAHDAAGRLAAEPDVHTAVGRGTHALWEAEPGRHGRCWSMAGHADARSWQGRRRSCLGSCGRPGRTGA